MNTDYEYIGCTIKINATSFEIYRQVSSNRVCITVKEGTFADVKNVRLDYKEWLERPQSAHGGAGEWLWITKKFLRSGELRLDEKRKKEHEKAEPSDFVYRVSHKIKLKHLTYAQVRFIINFVETHCNFLKCRDDMTQHIIEFTDRYFGETGISMVWLTEDETHSGKRIEASLIDMVVPEQ